MAKSILDMTVKEYMTAETRIKSAQKTDTIHKVVPLLLDTGTHHVAVFDGKEFAGFFGYKQLARLHRRPVAQTQIGDYIIKPPALSPDASIVDASEAMYRLNYKILPVADGKKLVGVLSERDILRAATDSGELNNRRAGEFMTPNPMTLKDTDSLGAAISTIRDKNVSRVPIVNKAGEAVGVFESLDMVRERYTKESSYGIFKSISVNPRKGSVTADAFTNDEVPDYKIAVKALMKDTLIIAKAGDGITEPLKEMLKRNMTSIIITDAKKRPVGIVVPKDIIQHVAQFRQKEAVYIQISGLHGEELITDFQKEEVHRMIDEAVRKLVKVVPMQFFTMHYKAYHTEGKRKKFSIRCKADTDFGLFSIGDYDWDVINATSKVLGAFEDLLISREQKIRAKTREREAHKKHARQG